MIILKRVEWSYNSITYTVNFIDSGVLQFQNGF